MAVETNQPSDASAPASRVGDPPRGTVARRVVIENLRPTIDAGRFPIKRTPGELVRVVADIFADGHDVIAAVLRDRHLPGPAGHDPREGPGWRETRMQLVADGTDEWAAEFVPPAIGWHEYEVLAWVDRFATWKQDLRIKAGHGQDVGLELLEGAALIREAAARAEQIGSSGPHAAWLHQQVRALAASQPAALRAALDDRLASVMDLYGDRSAAAHSTIHRVWVDRERARFGAWYEMFPRSAGPDPTRSGTFYEAAERLSEIADLGFDVVYLPPIHPIGRTFRKGPNNSLHARPTDPGSPWAIGAAAGGHDAVDPGLGSLADFEAFRAEAERLGLEVALDLAWQCSPDHPWVREHPDWFRRRPDGSIKHAENPPKKYQDIYPLDFTCADWRSLWQTLLDVTSFWIDRGVRIFRVDNPHTKPFDFWEWWIERVHARAPDVILLAEAFTRPKPMRYLAKAGFTQSYTHFTWRNTKAELTDYFTELTATDVREYLRPNLFANTPDILHAYLQEGGPPAFRARLLLAATLGASYGIYNGFELCERRAVPGTEEYWDSEKYQYRKWDWNRPGHIKELVARVNAIRRVHPALQVDRTLQFHATDNDQIVAYSKMASDRSELLLMVVNLDPHHMQHGFVQVPIDRLRTVAGAPGHHPAGGESDAPYVVHDLLDDAEYVWRGEWNYVRLDPDVRQGHVLELAAKDSG